MDTKICGTGMSNEDVLSASEEIVRAATEAYNVLDVEIRECIDKLNAYKELDDVKEGVIKLFEAFAIAWDRELEIKLKYQALSEEMQSAVEKFELFKKENMVEHSKIKELKGQLALAKHMADESHHRELQGHETIDNMRQQIIKLHGEMEMKHTVSEDDENNVFRNKESFERDRQRLIDEITSLKTKLSNALSYSEELERKHSAADFRSNELSNLLEQEISEGRNKQRQVESYEQDLAVIHAEYDALMVNLNDTQGSLAETQKKLLNSEQNLKEQKSQTDKINRMMDSLKIKLERSKGEQTDLIAKMDDLKDNLNIQTRALRMKAEDFNNLRNDYLKLSKFKDSLERKLQGYERLKTNMEQEKERMQHEFVLKDRELVNCQKKNSKDMLSLENQRHEIDLLQKSLQRLKHAVEEQTKMIKIQEQCRQKMEANIRNYISELVEQRKFCKKLEKDKNKAFEQCLDLAQKWEDTNDELKLKENVIMQNKELRQELETKLRQQHTNFEAIRVERNSYQKQLQDALSQNDELRMKLKISGHQYEQLKEDLVAKEELLTKQENTLRKVTKEKENYKIENMAFEKKLNKIKTENNAFKEKEKLMANTIASNETTLKKLNEEKEQIMIDKDVIGAQLVRRNDEIGLLYDKIKILEWTLHRGEHYYEKCIGDINILKSEVKRLMQEKNYLTASASNQAKLKTEVFNLERELAQERLKTRALEEELERPMNIHRWRKLEGVDPKTSRLMAKVRLLQKKIIKQTGVALVQKSKLQHAETMYRNLQKTMEKFHSPDLSSHLVKIKQQIESRDTKIKCLSSEVSMYQQQVEDYKRNHDKMTDELNKTKMKYFEQKKIVENYSYKLPPISTRKTKSMKTVATGAVLAMKISGGGFKF